MSVVYPTGTPTVRGNEVLIVAKTALVNQREARWQVSLTNSFPAAAPNLVFDSQLREPDAAWLTADTCEIELSRLGESHNVSEGAVAGTTYYVSVQTRTNGGATSGWATGEAFTIEAPAVGQAEWTASQ